MKLQTPFTAYAVMEGDRRVQFYLTRNEAENYLATRKMLRDSDEPLSVVPVVCNPLVSKKTAVLV